MNPDQKDFLVILGLSTETILFIITENKTWTSDSNKNFKLGRNSFLQTRTHTIMKGSIIFGFIYTSSHYYRWAIFC